jgi:outer membrane protein TolC
MRHARTITVALTVWCAARSTSLHAQESLTLDSALLEAHTANAQLPVAALDVRIAQAQLRGARRALGPRFSIDGDLHGGAPERYAGNDGRLQLLAEQPIYDGGAFNAGIGFARAQAGVSQARYRIAEKDLDFQIRVGFATLLELDAALAARRDGVARLERYLAVVEARQAAGEGVAGDVLKTRVQLGDALAAVADAERQQGQARMALNDILGRDPNGPLVLAPLAAPAPPPDTISETWAVAPEVRQAEAEVAAARSVTALVAAERRPHLALEFNAGTQPSFGTFGTGINNGQGQGAEFLLSLSWPLFDAGGYRARREQARLTTDQARASEVAVRRQARLAWSQARAELAARYGEVEARSRNATIALDSYLASESLYRGGGTTALDVLEAYTTWIAASEAATQAVFDYRVAEAQLTRWGTP